MKLKKILTFFIIIICILLLNTCVYSTSIDVDSVNIDNQIARQFNEMGSNYLSTLRIVGMIAAVAGMMIIGIRYMLSSVEEKASLKKIMLYYCIGVILIFALVSIVSGIEKWTSTLPL